MAALATHGCGARWVQRGGATSHCAGCHRNFSSTKGFDMHRVDTSTGRGCSDPASRRNRDGSSMFTLRTDASGAQVWEHASAAHARALRDAL